MHPYQIGHLWTDEDANEESAAAAVEWLAGGLWGRRGGIIVVLGQ